VTNDSVYHGLDGFFEDLGQRLGARLHSLFWNGQPERSNAVLGNAWQRVRGPEALDEEFAGVRLFYPPGAFGQSHLELAERIALRVAEFVPDGARVVEFYAGVGALGLAVAKRCHSLVLNEVGEGSLRGLALGIDALTEPVRTRVAVHPGPAGDAVHLVSSKTDVVIVDPPRKGLDAALLERLVQDPPARLVYVSCGLDALLRESDVLVSSGALELVALEAFALFPYTEHVETLAVFERT
jgi:tRNA/tmRNA/rRNA uracil-C5-methylase (TrmA/RlmC/RlmD family)